MFLGESDRYAELLRREDLLRRADQEALDAIWAAVLRNARLAETDSVGPRLDGSPLNHGGPSDVLSRVAVDSLADGKVQAALRSDDPDHWASAVIAFAAAAADLGHDIGDVSILVAAALIEARRVPLIGFAFSKWHMLHTPMQVFAAAELATNYMLRMVPIDTRGAWAHLPQIGAGASGIVRRDGDVVFKVAHNVAAQEFGMIQEARVLERGARTAAARFLPQYLDYDELNATLIRAHVAGPSGHDLLVARDPELRPGGRKEHALREAYTALVGAEHEIGVWLDLHPANLIWDGADWVLIDAGPVPTIAASYYQTRDPETYVDRVWTQRLANMQAFPIRSLDWEREDEVRFDGRS